MSAPRKTAATPSVAAVGAAVVGILLAIEAAAYVWMHPPRPVDPGPVLVWQPPYHPTPAPAPAASQPPAVSLPVAQALKASAFTPTPQLYQQAAPILRCSSGQVGTLTVGDSMVLHLAFFEWDDTDAGSVFEAFRHPPEICMGAIGMKHIATEPVIEHPQGPYNLRFTHSVFRDPQQPGGPLAPPVHVYRAIWVAGLPGAQPSGLLDASIDRLRHLRLTAATTRFRPPHARVIQGAVRNAPTSDAAWQAFQQTMLNHLQWKSIGKTKS